MHIAVNLGVQKIGSFQVDNLLPQEIDHELNMAQRRFVKQRYNPLSNPKRTGFEQSQKRLDDLRNLIEDAFLPRISYMGAVYGSPSVGDIFAYRLKLPTDYMHLVNIRADVFDACRSAINFKEVNRETYYLRVPITPPKRGYRLTEIKITNDSNVLATVKSNPSGMTIDDLRSGEYGGNVTPSLSPNDGFSDLTSPVIMADSPVADANEIFLKRTNKKFVQVQQDINNNGAYGSVVWTEPYTNEEMEVLILSGPIQTTEVNRVIDSNIITNNPGMKMKRTNCKYSQHDDLFAILDDPFNTTKSSSPLYTMQENFVDLYTTDKFLPNAAYIKYVRRPALMDYGRGLGSELPEHTHDEIVEMAVKSILEGIESPRYQSQSGEVLESE